jgi:hypothetical protein
LPEMIPAMRSAGQALLEGAETSSESLWNSSLEGLCAIRRGGWSLPDLEGGLQAIIRRGLIHPDSSRRLTAVSLLDEAYDLRAGGSTLPRDVVEILGTLLADPEIGESVHDNLTGPPAVPVHLQILDEGGPSARPVARDHLESLAAEPDGWTVIFEHLARPDGSIREPAVELLAMAGAIDGTGSDRAAEALASTKPAMRRAAVRILAHYHANGSVEADLLLPLVLDQDEDVVSAVVAALAPTGSLDAAVFQEKVVKLLDPRKPLSRRLNACRAARSLGTKAREAIPLLVDAARDEHADLAAEAIGALAVIAPEENIPTAVQALGHESLRVRNAALTMLWSLGSAAVPALPALRKLAEVEKDPDFRTRAAALAARLDAEQGRPARARR